MDEDTKLKILRVKDVQTVTGLSRSSIYAFVGRGEFPKQISLGSRSTGWLEKEVHDWVRQRVAVSRSGVA